jgi:TrmH family RNA methyltransferase
MRKRRIESARNPVVRETLRIRRKRTRYGREAFLIEGPNLVEAAALQDMGRVDIKQVLFTERFSRRRRGLIRTLEGEGAELYEVSEEIMEKLSDTETPQGIVAVSSYTPFGLDEVDFRGVTVVSDGIQDPGNLGTIIRTSDAAGARTVVLLPGTCDAFAPKALRASAGSIFNVPVVHAGRKALIGRLRELGIRICVTAPGADTELFGSDLRGDIAFVFGNEARGAGTELREAADLTVRIPIEGRAESLNVTVSVAVCLYEALRQKNKWAIE